MKRIYSVITFLLVVGAAMAAIVSPEKAVDNMLRAIKSADYKNSMNLRVSNSSGETYTDVNADFMVAGRKYSLHMADGTMMLYNGETLWVYMPDINEVTITEPAEDELMESNPLLALENKVKTHRLMYAENATADKYVINIFPPNPKECEYFKIELTLSPSDFLPSKVMIFNRNGDKIVLTLKAWTKTEISDSDFVFNAKDYNDVMINDLR